MQKIARAITFLLQGLNNEFKNETTFRDYCNLYIIHIAYLYANEFMRLVP